MCLIYKFIAGGLMKFKNKLLLFFALLFNQVNALTTNGNQIVNENGTSIQLKGINWFGFNSGTTMTDGLWSGPDDLSLDFSTVVYRMQLLGFNAVRLPFSFSDLYTLIPRNFEQTASQASESEIQASVTDPNATATGKIPSQNAPALFPNPNIANSYLPNDTTFNRFLWVVNFFAKNGFYVLIDNHLREDQTVLQQGKNAWVQDWVKLVTAISQDPVSKGKLIIDILNEPDNFGIRWEASGNTPALGDLYLALMDAVYPINPQALFFIEGTGQGGVGANWGDGFATDANLISQYGLSDPRPFFNALLQKPYLNQVAISPHIYPPSVTGASNDSGSGLWNRMTSSFGYLTEQGYCNGSKCKVFPVALGEFGSKFTDNRDIQWMADMATYLNNTGAAADGKHQAIGNWFYWCWNADSGDTGGIVSDDWRQIQWQKVEYLRTIGLAPWYASPQPTPVPPPPPVQQNGTLCLSLASVSGLNASSLQPISVGNYTFTIPNFNVPVCQQLPVGNYTITCPTITVGNTVFTAAAQNISVSQNTSLTATITYTGKTNPNPPPTPNPSSVAVAVQLGAPWQENGIYKSVINLYVTNKGTTTINAPWQLTLNNSAYLTVPSSWNLQINSVSNGTISATVPSSWEALGPNSGNTVNVGMIISSSSPNFKPTEITINGASATMTFQ